MSRLSLLTHCLSIAAIMAGVSVHSAAAETLENEAKDLQIAQSSLTEFLLLDVSGTLEPGDAQLDDGRFTDSYTFEGQAGQTVTILLKSNEFDTFLLLEDAHGNRLATNNNMSGHTRNSALIVVLPADGNYRALASGHSNNIQGQYNLSIASTIPEQPNQLIIDSIAQQLPAQQYFELGIQQFDQGQFRNALTSWKKALEMYQVLGDRASQGRIHSGLGIAFDHLSQYEHAIEHHQQSLAIALEIEDRLGENIAYGNLGHAYHNLGQYGQAIEYHQRSLAIALEIEDKLGEGAAYGNLGNVYHSLGQYEHAIEYHERRLDIFKEIEYRSGIGRAYSGIGNAHHNLEEYELAINYHHQALEIAQDLPDPLGEGMAYRNLGNAYHKLKQYKSAIQYYNRALVSFVEIEFTSGEAGVYGNLGLIHYDLGEYEQALDAHQKSLILAKEIGDRVSESIAYSNLGLAYWESEQSSNATQSWQNAIQVLETLRSESLSDIENLSLLDAQLNTYDYFQKALIEQRQLETALEIADRSRAQSLKLQLLQTLPTEKSDPWIEHLRIEKIKQIAVDQAATLVNYTVLWNGAILIWVIQPDGQIHQTTSNLAALPDNIDEVLSHYATSDAARGSQRPETPLQTLVRSSQAESSSAEDLVLDKLYQVLIAPVANLLPEDENEHVIFIPHRELFQVPFAALQNPETGEYLIENHTISTAPSILSLALTQERQAQLNESGSGALIVGNPTLYDGLNLEPLPGAEDEALAIKDLLKVSDKNVLIADAATEQAVVDRIHSARYLHFATHGLLLDKPRYSTIAGLLALAPSSEDKRGEFTVQDILSLTKDNLLNAELVVLSACRTGEGDITSDGAFGLARAFMIGGAPSLVVSLREVPDNATKDLMTTFYTELLETGDKAQSLRHAMLTTMKEHPDPRAWGAFVLIGQP